MASPYVLALINAAASIGGGMLSRKNPKETKIQKRQRATIDDLLASLEGQGPYADLFSSDEEAFQKGFADPARSRFQNVTAPQIQQQYIGSGMQRGTGMDDALTRAGVDLDSMINQNLLKFQQGGQDRRMQAIKAILSQGEGAEAPQSWGSAAAQSAGGYLSSDSFADSMKSIFDQPVQQQPAGAPLKRRPGYQ